MRSLRLGEHADFEGEVKLGIDIDGVLAAYQWEHDDFWNPEVYANCKPVDGALDGMQELSDNGHTLHVITARAEHPATATWLQYCGFPYDSLSFTGSKWLIPCHVYFDDGVRFLNGMYERNLVSVKYRYPHNIAAFSTHEVDSWPEFVKLIQDGIRGRLRRNPRKIRHVA